MIDFTDDEASYILNSYREKIKAGTSISNTEALVSEEFQKFFEKKAILGIDVFQYSKQPLLKQALIPYLLKHIYEITVENCLKSESFIFHGKTSESFQNSFIDTGDGGFQILENPLQAIVFAIYFQANINRYHVTGLPTNALQIVQKITLKYCLTYDNVYKYLKNFYGPAIINNARILSRDKLNRFLIDDNTVDWFTKELNGIENLQVIDFKKDFKNIQLFNPIFEDAGEKLESLIFNDMKKISSLDLLKIGEIQSKLDKISIHSLHIQVAMLAPQDISFKKFVISIGNLNSSGITD